MVRVVLTGEEIWPALAIETPEDAIAGDSVVEVPEEILDRIRSARAAAYAAELDLADYMREHYPHHWLATSIDWRRSS